MLLRLNCWMNTFLGIEAAVMTRKRADFCYARLLP